MGYEVRGLREDVDDHASPVNEPPTSGLAQWVQDAGLVQSFISYVLLALFLVTFVRKVSPT